ncbi:MAG TPA: PfkB family carbohydrate kinase [Candidatus Competibacteraceae bacterium]|nr:PfkB family carbohydrate kinase [Candidatus Competibacteraceae bacterium]
MSIVTSFGEALIDFVPLENGLPLAEVTTFARAPGGAPANVAAAVARLGGQARFAGQVGADAFGECLRRTLERVGVDTRYLLATGEAKTALAFVSLRADGERDFMFYREPSADMLMPAEAITPAWFADNAVFHFGSLTLTHPRARAATYRAVELARAAGNLVSFDPNLRLSLWPSAAAFSDAVRPLLGQAHVLKLSEEELPVLCPVAEEAAAVAWLLAQGVALVVITRGERGTSAYSRHGRVDAPSLAVTAVDTTGAGDAFVGGLLYQLAAAGIGPHNLDALLADSGRLSTMLRFANACGALTATRRGAIPALPDRAEVEAALAG